MAKSDINSAQVTTKGSLDTAGTMSRRYLGSAGSGYGEFAQTGGVSPGEMAATRQAAQGNVASLYDSLKRNLARRKAIQGGYSPGFGANESTLGREASSGMFNAVNQANLGLLEQQREGRLAGLGGLAGIGSEYLSQIPALQNIRAKLSVAKPGWMDLASQGLDLAGGVGTAIEGM